MRSRLNLGLIVFAAALGLGWSEAVAQEAVILPQPTQPAQAEAQRFAFVSDGPIGPGWTRPDQIARVYVHENLPALFRRTVRLDMDVPEHAKLSWIFTGP